MSNLKPHIYLKLYRISSREDSTLGMLFIERPSKWNIGERVKEYLCFTLEDEARESKIPGETRIPAGKYEIKLRDEGGYNARYSQRFKGIHKGMLELQDVPEFKYILIHCGNTEEDTAGCLLLGYDASRLAGGEHAVYKSTQAYFHVYPIVADVLDGGGSASIEIIEFDEGYKHMG